MTFDLDTASGGEAFLLSGPTRSSKSYIPKDAFPTMNQTHHSVLYWFKAKKVGALMSGVLPSTHGRPDLKRA